MEPINPQPFANLGGKRRTMNPKEFRVGGVAAAVYTFPATKARPTNRSYYFQGQRPACGAHAGTSFLDSLLMQKGNQPLQNNTPREPWIEIKTDGTSPSEGTTMDRIFWELENPGVIPFEPLENNVTFDDADYANTDALTAAVKAQQNKIRLASHAYLTDMTMNGIKQGINDFGAVLILFDVCARLYENAEGQTSWAPGDVCPLVPPSAQFPIIDGHFMVADYYDEVNICGPNSFSQQWGLNGDFMFQADYLPYIIEAGVGRLPVAAPSQSAIQTVQAALPQVQSEIQQLSTLTPEQKVAHANLFTEAGNILTELENLI